MFLFVKLLMRDIKNGTREHERKCRSKRLELKYRNSIIFLNDYFVSSEGYLNDFIADIDENVEDKALENIECFALQDAINVHLSMM